MRPIRPNVAYGELVINNLSAHTFAWCAIDIRHLYYPSNYRGSNLVMPHATGKRAQPYRIDESEVIVPLYFTGFCDENGNEYPDRFQGYEANIDTITTAWLEPGSPTLDATIDTPSGDMLVAAVQVVAWDPGSTENALASPFVWEAKLGLRIPNGRFV